MEIQTGMRIGEILALRWKRVDLLNGTLEVAETYSDGESGSPKTAQGLLWHSDTETTFNTYTRAIPDSQRKAVEQVAGELFGVMDSVGLNSGSAPTPDRMVN